VDQSADLICNATDTSGETSATDDQNATNQSRRLTQVRYPDDIKRWLIAQRRRNDSRVVSTAAAEDGKVLTLDSKSTGEWMVRVPTTRQAVMPDERFWTIPDNWEKRLTVASPYRPAEVLYSIPESDHR
jgi:hypothetical protein